MFNRDLERLDFVYKHTDFCPLGAGAVAGTTFKIDRQFSAKLLGFKNIYLNSMDAVSDRDYILEFLTFGTILSMHLSRFCEEIILWASSEFSFVEIDDAFATGSSMMPQKKNPDAAELIRGKTGRIFGHLLALLCVLKGLPLAYNKDLQEDKEGLFDTIDTLKISLSVFCKMLDTLKLNKEGIENSFKKDYSNATDLADYLVKKGLPFRKAHEISGSAVALALKENKTLQELPLPVLQKLSPLFEGDIFKTLEIENCADSRNSFGAGGAKQVKMQIAKAKEIIKKARKNKSNM
jgi:argininosuccinate lyase